MFSEVETAIVDKLRSVLNEEDFPGGIIRAIGKEDITRKVPLKFPAIRVFFSEANPKERFDLGSRLITAELTYQIAFFFKSLTDKNAEKIYPYLQKIIEAVTLLDTPKGQLMPGKVLLSKASTTLVYIINVHLETVL